MAKITIDIKNCKQCPHFKEKPAYTADSFERPHDWLCTHDGVEKKIQGYVEWHEENKIAIPEWCPIVEK